MTVYMINKGVAKKNDYPENDYLVFHAYGSDGSEIEDTIYTVDTIIINDDIDMVIFITTDGQYHQYFIKHDTWDLDIFH